MSKSINEIIQGLPKDRQEKIQKKADDLIAQEMSLRSLRNALNITQVQLAEKLDMKQESISRLERRPDMLLSTLDNYINALGGKLTIMVEFPNAPTVMLGGWGNTQ